PELLQRHSGLRHAPIIPNPVAHAAQASTSPSSRGVDQVTPRRRAADTANRRIRGNAEKAVRDDGELESWITDLAGGEPTVRKLRQRLDAEREPAEDGCPHRSGTATGDHA